MLPKIDLILNSLLISLKSVQSLKSRRTIIRNKWVFFANTLMQNIINITTNSSFLHSTMENYMFLETISVSINDYVSVVLQWYSLHRFCKHLLFSINIHIVTQTGRKQIACPNFCKLFAQLLLTFCTICALFCTIFINISVVNIFHNFWNSQVKSISKSVILHVYEKF